jgi:hypothetical protein
MTPEPKYFAKLKVVLDKVCVKTTRYVLKNTFRDMKPGRPFSEDRE